MRDFPNPYLDTPPPPPPPPRPPKSNIPMSYYGLVVVGAVAIVLAIYNLIIIKRCTRRESQTVQRPNRHLDVTGATTNQSFENPNRNLLTSFKYKKESDFGVKEQEGGEYECAVCLSVFEEGEEVKQLPRCKHSFHAPCIDMWLYSHHDCPLCRTSVEVPRHLRHAAPATADHSREGLLSPGFSA